MKTAKKAALVIAAAGAMVGAVSGAASANDAEAHGAAVGSPGVISGNVVQAPIHIPVNACGNTINVVGVLNPAFGNTCINNVDIEHHDHDNNHKDNNHHHNHNHNH